MKKKILPSIAIMIAVPTLAVVSTVSIAKGLGETINAATTSYTLILNSSNCAFLSDEPTTGTTNSTNSPLTTLGNPVYLTYENAFVLDGHIGIKGNIYSTNGLKGLTAVTVTLASESDANLYFGTSSSQFGSATAVESNVRYEAPSGYDYFKLEASDSTAYVSSIKLEYTCSDNPVSSSEASSSSQVVQQVKVYKRVDSLSSLDLSKKTVICAPDASAPKMIYAMTTNAKSSTLPWYIVGTEVQVDSSNEIEEGDFAEWDISKSGTNYSFVSDGKYLQSYVDGTHYSINIGNNSSYSNNWTLTFGSEGLVSFYSDRNVYLEYYKGSFCGYKNSCNAYLFQENGTKDVIVSSSTVSDGSSYIVSSSGLDDDMWAGLDFSTYGTTFRNTLAGLITAKNPSSTSYKQCLQVGAQAAAYPNENSSTFIPFYHEAKSSEQTTTGNCNREHTWPDSRGGGSIETDPLVIRPTLNADNSSRGNNFYGNTKSNEWDPASCGYEGARGESARIILYAACRYYSLGLSLSNNPSDATSAKTMGTLKTLLEWNSTYQPTDFERTVNERYYKMGYARNPFVDHPEYANFIWDNNGLRTTPVTLS